mmetsp:Transcript_38496/g.89498  ORF Transcript_38496/g.89498 Transcript_38496/m.89498 type:complete len:214 (-) Transcript_38496:415-1056(-)
MLHQCQAPSTAMPNTMALNRVCISSSSIHKKKMNVPASQPMFGSQQSSYESNQHNNFRNNIPQQQQYAQHESNVSPSPPPPPKPPSAQMASMSVSATEDLSVFIKKQIFTQWALQPPNLQTLRSVDKLLGSIQETFPPFCGIKEHEYFVKRWKPFTASALSLQRGAVLKRGVRKVKFFLHPDKLPKDFNKEQLFLCKMLWDITNDAWELFKEN